MATTERPRVDLLDGAFYVGDPYAAYAWMREHEPVYWDPVNELWGIARYDDIVEVEKHKHLFINSDQEKGGYRPNIPADPAIIGLDDPLHSHRRNLVARRFTPKAVSRWEDHVRGAVSALLDAAMAHGGTVEVVGELAAPLPAEMIGLLLGFPEETFPQLVEWSERTIEMGGGPRYFNETGMTAAMEFAQASAELYEEKRRCPADDVMTLWTQAEVPGHPFGVDEVISDCLLLLDGGAETTRTVIARGMIELSRRPEQWALLREQTDLTIAVEELIRFVTPIHNMCRVAAEDAEVAGTPIAAGQQLVLMYSSANRDPEHFEDPEEMDLARHPNHHIAFGFGTHFCLGSSLARLEIRIFFEELLQRVAELRVDEASIEEMPNAFVYGLRSARMDLTPV
ncbi:cytochrome P450 [Dermatobacter hominis]|uniref:cytochrome P450 n=1 Tax=Dermatobacter hominis TaxID=2884263 RepID=UPI001D107C15|nr:cytochrome P450 [Dermatobacter hominis]UDY35375.1 cytochrome P450 [Dermatobacter hominis]